MGRSGAKLRAIPPMASTPPNITQRDANSGCAGVEPAAAATHKMIPMIVRPTPAIFLPARVAATWFTVLTTCRDVPLSTCPYCNRLPLGIRGKLLLAAAGPSNRSELVLPNHKFVSIPLALDAVLGSSVGLCPKTNLCS